MLIKGEIVKKVNRTFWEKDEVIFLKYSSIINNTILDVYSIYTYFLFCSTYSSSIERTTFVRVCSLSIARILRSFINLLGILIDKCAFSAISYHSPFFCIVGILIYVICDI